MDAIIERCAGLDVHRDIVVSCVLQGELDKTPKKEIREFSTTTKGLLELLDYLLESKCTHVAMESTGVYWKPVWNILETGQMELIIANARRIKNVPGRKTDVKDAEWIAKLLRCGLIEKSFVPCEEIRDLRDLTRLRKSLSGELTREINRVHKVLQDANVKLSTVLSDVLGETGRRVLNRIVEGKMLDKNFIMSLYQGRGKGKLKATVDELYEAFNGKIREHHRQMLKIHLDHIFFIEKQISEVENHIEEKMQSKQEEVSLLDSIPGINEKGAAMILAEIGTDMEQFPNSKAISSWSGLSPGNNESAGKKKRGSITSGNKWLMSILCECAWAATLKKDSRISKKYWSMVSRMGKKKALVAIANMLLRIIYTILKTKEMYKEQENEYLIKKEQQREARLIKQLKDKGYVVEKLA